MRRDIKDTVRKLLAKAESVAGTPEEQVFKAKAMELIAKNNIDEAELRSKSDSKSEIVSDEVDFTGHHIKMQMTLMNNIAAALGCSMIRVGKNKAFVYGTEDSLDQVDWLFGMLWSNAIIRAMDPKNTAHLNRGQTTTWRRSFLIGFTTEVASRIKQAYRKQSQDTGDSKGAALVLADDARRAEQALRAEFGGQTRESKLSGAGDLSAFGAGVSHGRNSDIGQSRMSGAKAIGR